MYPLLFKVGSYCWQQSPDAIEVNGKNIRLRVGDFFPTTFDSPVQGPIQPIAKRTHVQRSKQRKWFRGFSGTAS
jgi:hypothetical protein